MAELPRILVVDDESTIRLLIREVLEQRGFQVLEAEDGPGALKVFDEGKPDLVLLDVFMPGLDGFQVCRHLRARPGAETIPIIIITGTEDYDAIRRAYEAGATDFIGKPINWIILGERVRYMLRASAAVRQLAQNREFLARAQALARLGSFEFRPGKATLDVSPEFCEICGLSCPGSEVDWEDVIGVIHPDDWKALEPLVEQACTAGICFRQDIRLVTGNGIRRYAMLQVDAETDADGAVARLTGIIQDITERKLAELLETDSNRILQLIVQKEPLERIFREVARLLERQLPLAMGVVCLVADDKVVSVTAPGAEQGFSEAVSGTALSAESGTHAAAAYLGQPVVAPEVFSSTFWRRARHVARAFRIRSSAAVPVFSGTGQILGAVSMVFREEYQISDADVALMEKTANLVALAVEQHQLSQRLIHQARHDPLTGLVNRAALNHWLERVLKERARHPSLGAYLLIDLDRFKHINDSLGHHVGDLMLKQVADRLRQAVRDSDLLCRMGGDEFVLILDRLRDKNDAARAASRILEHVGRPFHVEGHELHVGASIGITLFPDDAVDTTTLHKNADIAMYVAKNQGGNRYHFFDGRMHEAVIQRLQVENDLRKALERNEFQLHYQPQVDLTDNRVVAMEALIRWNHPERGRIPPDRFISIAEECRLIIPIGRWVLQEACRQAKLWQDQGLEPIRVAVNVSAVQFTETDFAETVRQVLQETGLEARWLEVEITETVVMKDQEVVRSNLKKLKDLGVVTTLDDFGTGYSSVTYLRQMPLDGIKIDKSFIRDLETAAPSAESKNAGLVKAFVNLAANLHLSLVAEGIETEDQRRFLLQLGCSRGQGFLFNPPVPAEEATALLRDRG